MLLDGSRLEGIQDWRLADFVSWFEGRYFICIEKLLAIVLL